MKFYEVPAGWTAEVIVRQREQKCHGTLELRFEDEIVGTVVITGASDESSLMHRLRHHAFQTAVRGGLVAEKVRIKG